MRCAGLPHKMLHQEDSARHLTAALALSLLQEHTNTIRRFQFVSLQEAAAYVAKADKPDQRGGPQQEITAAQPSMPWSLILEFLELTEHQRKVRIAVVC